MPAREEKPQRRQPSPVQMAVPAALTSFVAPGIGHFIVRAWWRGLLWLAGWIFLSMLSGVAESPIVLILMLIAGVDAYVVARNQTPTTSDVSDEHEHHQP